jgi:Holliday junction resolvase RusA-like endonuclease
MTTITFTVEGTPVPQGSMKSYGRGRMVHSNHDRLTRWRNLVTLAGMQAWGNQDPIDGPCQVLISVYLPRPHGHYGTGRNAHQLKPSAPLYPHRKPDSDKLIDAITASHIWTDDSRAVSVHLRKHYADRFNPGANITITTEDHP